MQPWRTSFQIWNQSVVPCPVLTVASWPVSRFLYLISETNQDSKEKHVCLHEDTLQKLEPMCRLCLPKITVLKPDAPCDGIRWDFWEVIRAWRKSPWWDWWPYKRDPRDLPCPFLYVMADSSKSSVYEPGSRSSCWCLDLGLIASRTVSSSCV